MPEPSAPSEQLPPPLPDEDRVIRQRVRELTSQVLQEGRINTAAVADVVRAVTAQTANQPMGSEVEAREAFADAVTGP